MNVRQSYSRALEQGTLEERGLSSEREGPQKIDGDTRDWMILCFWFPLFSVENPAALTFLKSTCKGDVTD